MNTLWPSHVFLLVIKCTNELKRSWMPWATRYNPRGIQTRGLSVINGGNSPKSSLYFSLRIRHWVKQQTRRPLRKCEMPIVNPPGGDIKKGGCLISPLLLVFMWFPYWLLVYILWYYKFLLFQFCDVSLNNFLILYLRNKLGWPS